MTKITYILKSFIYYLRANLLVVLGVAVSTMVMTGSLIIGDSVRHSLEQATFYRLGSTTHLVAVNERYFRQELAAEIEADNPEIVASPLLLLEGVAIADGGRMRVNRAQVIGVFSDFDKIAKTNIYSELAGNEIIISRNMAEKLEAKEGDNILLRIKKASLIPLNAPFVSDEETSVSYRATVKGIADKEELGRFNLKTSQSAPYNVFISGEQLNRLMDFKGRANNLLVITELDSDDIKQSVAKCLTPADAGLKIRQIEAVREAEISTERVFMEPVIARTLEQLPHAKPVITYFVNSISLLGKGVAGYKTEGEGAIPYTFVSSIEDERLSANEIILTRWAADDLDADPGDKVLLKYFEIGPLRQLTEKEAEFTVKEVVPMSVIWADSTRMPWLPGLSDAGHCREWEAGVPINLDAIRDKDEDYWNRWKGAPKAYISLDKAREIWENRFGIYTAVRFSSSDFDIEKFNAAFAENIHPGDLGMAFEAVREQGISASQNGTDFSSLFLGLSFFILAASIILTSLLFRLNLEARSGEVGILTALGFKENQVRGIFILEGLVVAAAGGIAGLALSFLFTRGVFHILNTLWFEIVRTNVLMIKIVPFTLMAGLVVSLAVSMAAIVISLLRYQRRKTADLQKRSDVEIKKIWRQALNGLMWLLIGIPLIIFVIQLLMPRELNPMLFFISGALLLSGLLLVYRRIITDTGLQKSTGISMDKLARLNLTRNRGRSLTVVILFALGTFIVVSTGSYKLDLLANAQDKSSGTGGFLYFAETTMPVLYDLNSVDKRAEEGINEDFRAVQFRRVEGDDASCLNLNRIEQPAILGVNPDDLSGRFSFATRMKGVDADDLWKVLDMTMEDGYVPAIADQTVIQWGLGKKTGDHLLYQNENGDTLRLKLIAGTTPSVFQGYVIISNKYFLKNYPSSSGSNIFLIEGQTEREKQIGEELASVYRDYGWEMESTARRLVEFYSVTNTYLSIFLALGALGMIIGTFGLAVILARTIMERKREIALMQALGFRTNQLFRLLLIENLLLLGAGVLTGFITAVAATLPAFLSANTDASLGTVTLVVALILINGFCWIAWLSWYYLRNRKLITGLSVD